MFLLVLIAVSAFIASLWTLSQNKALQSELAHLHRRIIELEDKLITLTRRARPEDERREAESPAATPKPQSTETFAPAPPTAPVNLRSEEASPLRPVLAPLSRPPREFQPPVPMVPALQPPQAAKLDTAGIEERLGGRAFVWIAALAFALAGVFLVKYSFDRNLLTPPIRIMMGIAFGVAMLGAGEFMRLRVNRIAQGLSAAGIAVLFTSLLAASNLYHLIAPITGFVLMAVVTALAVVLSLRQGPFVALLGLLGGFLTPVLIRTGENNPSLFIYLLMLELALLGVTRRRGWFALAALTLAGGGLWAFGWLVGLFEPAHGPWIGAFLLITTAAFIAWARWGIVPASNSEKHRSLALAWAATLVGLILCALLVGRGSYTSLEWGFLWLLACGCLVVGRLDRGMIALPWAALAVGLFMLLAWSPQFDGPPPGRYALTMLAFAVLFSVGGYLCLWRHSQPVVWMALSIVSTLAHLALAHQVQLALPAGLTCGRIAAGLAVVYLVAGIPLQRRRALKPEFTDALAAVAVAATALIGIGAEWDLRHQRVALVWALELPLLAFADRRLQLPTLRPLTVIVGGWIALRLAFNPAIPSYPISQHPLFNWLVYGYGVPILAAAIAARIYAAIQRKEIVEFLGGIAVGLGAVFIAWEIRQCFHPAHLSRLPILYHEWAWFTALTMIYGWALLIASRQWSWNCLSWGGILAAGLGSLVVLKVQLITDNPLAMNRHIGDMPVFNWLLWFYGLPACLGLIIARLLQRMGRDVAARLFGIMALVLCFMLVTLEVRQYFHGPFLNHGTTSLAEKYSYSVAWILFGSLLLIIGILTHGQVVRYASAVVMLLAIAKVFLYDTANLRDLYRVFSLFGLGLSLLVLAYLYQRYVFRPAPPPKLEPRMNADEHG